MNQRTRIWSLIQRAAREVTELGLTRADTQTKLAAEGYDLRRLPDDIQNLNSAL